MDEETLHDLRSPITLIRGYAQMMLEEAYGPLTDDQIAIMERLIGAVAALDDFINAHD